MNNEYGYRTVNSFPKGFWPQWCDELGSGSDFIFGAQKEEKLMISLL